MPIGDNHATPLPLNQLQPSLTALAVSHLGHNQLLGFFQKFIYRETNHSFIGAFHNWFMFWTHKCGVQCTNTLVLALQCHDGCILWDGSNMLVFALHFAGQEAWHSNTALSKLAEPTHWNWIVYLIRYWPWGHPAILSNQLSSFQTFVWGWPLV